MKLSIFVVSVAISLSATTGYSLTSGDKLDKIDELIDVVKDQNQLASARQNDVSQAINTFYQMPDVQAALKAIPELTVRIGDGEQQQLKSETQIAYMKSVQDYHAKRIDGIESSGKIQIDILSNLKIGLERALFYIDDKRKGKDRLLDAFVGFLFAAALASIGWVFARILSLKYGSETSHPED